MTERFLGTTRLLVIDESDEHRLLLSQRLATHGYEITETDSASALALIESHDFDLVLLDTTRTGPRVFDLVETIRVDHSPSELPIVVVTAHRENADILRALKLGANDYITPPIDFTIVSARIQIQLARRATQQALASSVRQLVATNRRLADEIAEHKRTEMRVHHIAHHDGLTGLGNRVAFHERLQRELARLGDGDSLAVIVLDLDGFKRTNDALGQRVGDALLATVGHSLQDCLRNNGAVMRVGSDEFAIIKTGNTTPLDAGQWANAISRAVAVPCRIGDHEITLDCSIGIALAPDDGNNSDLLLSHAYLAMHRAKTEGRDTYRFFEPDMDAYARTRRTVESDLRKALPADQFEIYYQPLFNLATNSICGFEALLRWHHPERGMIPPDVFIPMAEEIGVIASIGAWVLQQACREAARWPDDTKLAVNISALQFRDPDLLRTITAALTAADLPAQRLELEITETVVLDNDDDALDTLHRLRGLGIRISMDDFGTGYSSLSYLRKFPFDKIKIDQSFIRDLDQRHASDERRDTRAIVRAVTGLASGMGMMTTAEGVETMEQMDWLRGEGCTEIQGYLMSRPVPAADIDALLRMSHAARTSA